MWKDIPEGSVEIQTGLWLYSYNKTIGGTEYTFRQLFASEGYVFYDNTKPENERDYMVWLSLGFSTDVNDYTSIPYEEGMDVAGNTTKPEIA